jgi:hypothetical protein
LGFFQTDGTNFGKYRGFGSKTLYNYSNSGFYPSFQHNGGIVHPRSNVVGSCWWAYLTEWFASWNHGDGYSFMWQNNWMNPDGYAPIEMMQLPLAWGEQDHVDAPPYGNPPTVVGHMEFLRMVNCVQTNARLNGGKYAVFGPGVTSSWKIAVPWSPTYKGPLHTRSREGVKILETQNV